jgi:2,4-dienoyl-CoA reductase-like NADH-dependent reductase (Old Yellow Enzyme family)
MIQRKESIVFRPGRIGNIELKNRLVRSATYDNAATAEGRATEKMIEIYRTLARGGIGLIITGIVGVYKKAVAPHLILGNYDDSYIPELKKISQAVHEADGDCKIMAQLHHPGRQVIHPEDLMKFLPYLPKVYMSYIEQHPEALQSQDQPTKRIEPTAPSAVYDNLFDRTPRELAIKEINEIIDAYVEGIRRVQEAGFDGVQLHAAHGYLLSSFLSPHTNKRDDQYGGSAENRTRIIAEIYKRSRKKVGENFPIIIKFNTMDFLPDGIDIVEAAKVGKILSKIGFDAIETSGGMWEALTHVQEQMGWTPVLLPESRTEIRSKDQEGYFLAGATALKDEINNPIILVGGLRSFDKIEEILESGNADFISLSRPLIRQPDLPNLWLSGSGKNKAECISCNGCLPIGAEVTRCRAKKE